MIQRLIGADASEIRWMSKEELFQSIKVSEGHVILSGNVVVHPSVVDDITYTKMSKARGADTILLNIFDVNQPIVVAACKGQCAAKTCVPNDEVVHRLRELVGLPIGMNAEPVDESLDLASTRVSIEPGREASAATFKKANELGLDFILLTDNPGTGTTDDLIVKSVALAKKRFDSIIIVGKMHSPDVDEPVISLKSVRQFIEAGADTVLVPAVGIVQGIGDQQVKEVADFAHSKGKLITGTIGASQKNAQPGVTQATDVRSKILGVDIQHIGDANMGLAGVENIEKLSDAVRRKRRTVARTARSISR